MSTHGRHDSAEIGGVNYSRQAPRVTLQGRPWIGVFFRCCHVYARVFRNVAGTAYVGRCPRCRCEISARVGSGGTTQRIFYAE